jgi:hypothetical protein
MQDDRRRVDGIWRWDGCLHELLSSDYVGVPSVRYLCQWYVILWCEAIIKKTKLGL